MDNDQKGRDHGQVVGAALASVAREVKLLALPGLPEKGDLWDWIDASRIRAHV